MAEPLTDLQRVLRLSERLRLLIAVSDEVPIDTKLNTQGVLEMFEATVGSATSTDDQARAAGYYQLLHRELEPFADLEALLAAMRVFAPYL